MQVQSSFLNMFMLIRKVNIYTQGLTQWKKQFELDLVSMELTLCWKCVSNISIIKSTVSIAKMAMFHWNQAAVEILLSAHCISLRPLSDSHLPSGLETRAHDWMVWKEWGKARSVSLGKGQGLRPFDNTCQGLAHTHTPCIFWMRVCSLLSAIWPHLHIKSRAKWPNAGFDAKQTQWFTGLIPSSDPASDEAGYVSISTFTAYKKME